MANLNIGLLGPLQVMPADRRAATFESDKARALLAYLVTESDRPHRRGNLVGLLWPDMPDEVARRNLRQTLYSLRQSIGDHSADPPYLLISREQIQFNPAGDYTLDVKTFLSLIDTCEKNYHPCTETCALRAERLQQAVGLYRGEFLEQFFVPDSSPFEEWAVRQREALHRRALESLDYLARYEEMAAHYDAARRYAQQALALDPWREESHRQLMRALALLGQRSEALAQYETCRRVLADELGVEPSAETKSLYEQISRERLSARREPHPGPAVAPHSLPAQLTPFIGRERELSELAALIAESKCRLLTLVGPGGSGKTRLALQLADRQREQFAHGAAFVALNTVASGRLISASIGEALGLVLTGTADPAVQLVEYLRDRELLLVLDGVEHLLEGLDLLIEILRQAPGVKLLVTSREQLNLQQEWIFEVGGLDVPAGDQDDAFARSAAVMLFMQRARRAQVGFALRPGERAAVLRICRLVGGLPLAIELAATWVRTLSCAEIAAEIERSVDFLGATVRDLPERHRSMRAVCDQSCRLLGDDERTALRVLSVFRGGFTRDAALAVARADLQLLSSLLAKSLIRRIDSSRYSLHEVVRQYGEERLVESGACEDACRRHFEFFLRLAEEIEPKLIGPGQVAWLSQLEKEHDNLRTALEWALRQAEPVAGSAPADRAQPIEALLRFAGALYLFWKRGDHWIEGREWLGRALSTSAGQPPNRTRAKALNGAVLLAVEAADVETAARLSAEQRALADVLDDRYHIALAVNAHGYLLWKQKEYAAARARCEQASAEFRGLGKTFELAESLHYLGHIATNQGDLEAARQYLDESALHCARLEDKLGSNFSIGDLGLIAYLQDEPESARLCFERSLAGFREINSRPGMVSALNGLGDLARYQGQDGDAGRRYAEALELYRAMGDKDEIPSLLHNLACVEQHRCAYDKALSLFREALAIHRTTGNRPGTAECLAGIASVRAAEGKPRVAAQLMGAAEALRRSDGGSLWPANRKEHERTLGQLRAALDADALAQAWAEGESMTSARALALAMEG